MQHILVKLKGLLLPMNESEREREKKMNKLKLQEMKRESFHEGTRYI